MASTEDIRGHYVKVNSTRIFYDEIGEGYPIVCVHTAGACSLEYTYLLPLLAEQGFHAYALDLPGHFRSYPVNWKPHRTIHEHAEFVHAFANTLGLKKPVIMGCSIGGDITLDYAAHHWREMAAGIPMEGLSRSPTFPSPAGVTHPAWGPGWQDQLERAATESLNRNCSAEKITELRWQHRGPQVSAVGDLVAWATHDVRGAARCRRVSDAGDMWRGRFLGAKAAGRGDRQAPEKRGGRHLKGIGHYPMFEDPALTAKLTTDFCRKHFILK